MSVNIFYAKKPTHFNDGHFVEPTINKNWQAMPTTHSSAVCPSMGHTARQNTAVELIEINRGATKSDIHYVHTNGSQLANFAKQHADRYNAW